LGHVGGVGIDVNGKIKIVGGKNHRLAIFGQNTGLQNVEPLDDENIRAVYAGDFTGQNVIGEVGINRGGDPAMTGLYV